jgi:hypothetical protein
LYEHFFPSLDEQLAERLDRAFRETRNETDADQMRTKLVETLVSLKGRQGEKAL